jgi:glutamyl-tRNA synthetase
MIVRTRFAPSPTGQLHLGNVRTALYAWLFARGRSGEFVLRIEDTDRERSTKESLQIILDSMEWLGLNYDIGPIYQSARLAHYREIAEQMVKDGKAYRCYCTKERLEKLRGQQLANKEKPRYDGCCRTKNLPDSNAPCVIRFKNPEQGTISFHDQVYGAMTFDNNELDDLVIIRADGYPTYNFSVVIDDLEVKITHVIRGADHINNTPRQINIINALGAKPFIYAHVPMILGNDGKLLSKRHGAISVLQYKEQGLLAEAMLNYLVRLGWSHGDQEIFSREELIKFFDIGDINKAAAAFNQEKLLWLNRHYLKTLDPRLVAVNLKWHMDKFGIDCDHGPNLAEIVQVQAERSETLCEMAAKSRYFYEDFEQYEQKASEFLQPEIIDFVVAIKHRLTILLAWTDEALHQVLEDIAKQFELKLGKVAQPIRVAVTGSTISPPLNTTLRLLGKKKVLERLDKALAFINAR